ncbi:conserved protein of unknown function, putative repressor protein [Methylorubrum extorquens DM4]|uniref:Uncharacterized protein n=1 Tax=Methylorubrum extorquens (strain DSM 6343 / CIP 106787 / DM4) TaxID=661410 RepID=C7C7P2_METED|nr:conserved protein of unknown function, putative repressor protein [Methylorubrum extorquens DM4]
MGLFRVDELPDQRFSTVRVPLMGPSLCAGFPSPADEFVENALELPRWLVPNPPAAFLCASQASRCGMLGSLTARCCGVAGSRSASGSAQRCWSSAQS